MKKSLLVVLATLTATSGAFAVENATSTKEIKEFERSILNESKDNRKGKRFTINAALYGVTHRAQSTSVEVGYHLNANNVISIQGSTMTGISGAEDEVDSFEELRERHGKGTSVALGLKHFVGNSFYVKPEIYSRNQEFVYSALAFGDTVIALEEGEIQDTGVNLRIGNQWQWENFTLGCDWIGFKQSLGGTKEGTVKSGDINGLSSALNFYLGATF